MYKLDHNVFFVEKKNLKNRNKLSTINYIMVVFG